MAAPATCIVSGNLYDPTGAAVSGATVKAYVGKPLVLTGNNFIPASLYGFTQTDTDGSWSLAIIQTAGLDPVPTVTIKFLYPNNDAQDQALDYAIVVPEDPTADFNDLIDMSSYY